MPSLPSLSPAVSTASSRPVDPGYGASESAAVTARASVNTDSGEASGKDAPTFAVVLQRQLAQATSKDAPPAAVKIAAPTTEDAAPPIDGLAALLLSMGTMVKPDASLKLAEKKPADEQLTDPAAALTATAAQVIDPAAALLTPAAPKVSDPALVTTVPQIAAPALLTATPQVAAPALVTTAPQVAAPALVTTAPQVAAPALITATATSLSDAAGKLLADAAAKLIADAAAKTPADSAAKLVADAPAKRLAPATQETHLAAAPEAVPAALPATKADVVAAQEPASDSLAALQALSMGASAKPDTALKMTEKKPASGTEIVVPLASSSPEPKQTQFEIDSAAKKVQDAAITAATTAQSAEAKAELSPHPDVVTAKVSFENQLASAQTAIQPQHSEAPAAVPLKVETPVGAHGWDAEIGNKVVWMVGHQQQRAELVLNPPALGRVEVTLSMTGDQANASFTSANPAVRDALEAALPRLRETLADAGISLGQTNVGSQSSNQYANKQENWDNPARSSDNFAPADRALPQIGGATPWLRQSHSLVDVFA